MTEPLQFDITIVGSGLAGLSTALKLADQHTVLILCKRSITDTATSWAQGGIAAALDQQDHFSSHIEDTLVAGADLCDYGATKSIVEEGPNSIDWLIAQGVQFTKDAQSALHLTREGGHQHRRIIHSADATGAAIQKSLTEKVLAHPNITVLESHCAIDLITAKKIGEQTLHNQCYGLYAQNTQTDEVLTIQSRTVVLATGGAGKVYLYTTNPDTATGDGIAIAWRAGCRVANMEFIQFHPTCLYHPYAKSFLISEAVRGEGGLLQLPQAAGSDAGLRFMSLYDPRAELASRDIVARAIDDQMKKRGLDCVELDIRHQPRAFLQQHFPTIYDHCLQLGIDIHEQAIPVVPAAHYTCGGVVTNLHGATDIAGLYAIGETAYTGLHGANRLASNSLLECVVIADFAAHAIVQQLQKPFAEKSLPLWDESQVSNADEEVVIAHNWDELRRLMWNYVGIVRTTKRLLRARHRIQLLKEEINEYYRNFRITRDLLELRNLVEVADLIVVSALSRQESRGLHFSRDYPETLPKALPTVLNPLMQTTRH